eukprot:CAMPEP_0197715910 /NCGR_PEP_ID=MMETSP1434-20131217/978_1 /TAXON_ID=265543 /ORGANISM="Minutocellus polymorphus, Strain CCMP3303" /LENGTH=85 /DNA_ID=CAMNT_0043300173 /DNA_START=9 /DNA_END=262 /DNA_ORIENTATION=+
MARAIKLREQERVSVGSAAASASATPTIMSQVHPSQVHLQAPQAPAQPKMATAAAATVDLTGSPPPQRPGAIPGGTGLSRLPEGG